MKLENIGWGISFQMVCDNYYKLLKLTEYSTPKPKKPKRRRLVKNLGFYDNPVKMQFDIAKILTEPEPNFHYE